MMTFLQANPYQNLTADQTAGIMAMSGGMMIFGILLYLFFAFCLYKIFKKANLENAWMAFIPVLQYLPMMQMAKKPSWWIVLLLIPFVNIIIAILVWIKIAKSLGKSDVFGILMPFLGVILLPVMAFDNSTYNGSLIPDER